MTTRPDGTAPVDPVRRLLELDLELPSDGTGVRTSRRRSGAGPEEVPPATGPSRRWMAVFSALLVGSLLAAVALAYIGIETVRNSRAGRSVSSVTDPAAPGFEAFVEPTPTLAVLHMRPEGLAAAAVLATNSGDVGGSVLVVPPSARQSDLPGALPISVAAFFGDDPAEAVGVVQAAVGTGISEVVVLTDDRLAELVRPVEPLRLDNPDALPGFPAGPLELTAAEVGPFLAARAEGEVYLARMFRQELFWRAWSDAVRASGDPGAVPGEIDAGIGRFVRALGAGPAEVATLPVVESTAADGSPSLVVLADEAEALVNRLVAFPTAAKEGDRVRLRLLDGTGQADHVALVAPLVIPAGSQVVVAGNADRFDYQQTEFRYHAPDGGAAAEHLQEALGVGTVVEDVRPIDAFDVTIVLGTDL